MNAVIDRDLLLSPWVGTDGQYLCFSQFGFATFLSPSPSVPDNIASGHVFLVRYEFEVGVVDASTIPTQMVGFQASGDWTYKGLVAEPMRGVRTVFDPEPTIPLNVEVVCPEPARGFQRSWNNLILFSEPVKCCGFHGTPSRLYLTSLLPGRNSASPRRSHSDTWPLSSASASSWPCS